MTMNPTLTLSGDFAHSDLDSLCEELQHLREWTPGQSARVDLRKLNTLEPTTLAVLLASLRGLHRRQICDPLDDFVGPEGEESASCLSPEALRGLILEGVGHWQEMDGTILGCEVFVGTAGIDTVTSILQRKLISETDWSAASLSAFGSMVFELTENVIQHSDAQGGVVVLEISSAEQRVSLAIADNGVGVRESLARNPDFLDIADDLTAIIASMGAGATGEPGTGGGMGLYFARMLVRSNNGSFQIRSGNACREESRSTSDSTQLPSLHGTLISVETRTDFPLDYGQIEESLKQPDGIVDSA